MEQFGVGSYSVALSFFLLCRRFDRNLSRLFLFSFLESPSSCASRDGADIRAVGGFGVSSGDGDREVAGEGVRDDSGDDSGDDGEDDGGDELGDPHGSRLFRTMPSKTCCAKSKEALAGEAMLMAFSKEWWAQST